jgi:tetratricopeptide (TPR) repeat protein
MNKAQLGANYPWYFGQPWSKIFQVLGWPTSRTLVAWRSLSFRHKRLREWYERFWNWYGSIIISAAWDYYFGKKEYTMAAWFANSILQFLPDYPEALCLLGAALANLGEDDKTRAIFWRLMEMEVYSEAETLAQEIIATCPENAEYYNWLGQALQKQNKLEEAITAYYKLLSLDPDSLCVFKLGLVLLEKGRKEEARLALLRAMIYDPSNEVYIDGFIRSFSNEPDKMPKDIPPPAFEFFFPRILAAKYLNAKRDGESTEEIEDLIKQVGEEKSERSPQMAYISHLIVTGHWNAESQLLRHFKRYIKGPVLNVGCGTGEQSLLAAHFLDELPNQSAGVEVEDENKSRKTFVLSYKDKTGNQSLIGAFSLSGHEGTTRFTLGGIDLEKGEVIRGINLFPRFPGESVELSEHRFTVVSVDVDAKSLVCAARIMPFLAQNQRRLGFLFTPCDIREAVPQPQFNTVLVCYLFHWLGDGLPAAVHNIASALKPGGYLVVLGECPIKYVESPFLKYASSIHGKPNDVSPQEIVALCTKEGLRLVEEKEVEILTINPKDRHPMFGIVFRKE